MSGFSKAQFANMMLNIDSIDESSLRDLEGATEGFYRKPNNRAYNEIIHEIHQLRKNSSGKSKASKINDKYIELLNKWACRIGKPEQVKAVKKSIAIVERKAPRIERTLESLSMSDMDNVVGLFGELRAKKWVGGTIASKILSLAKPDLFAMLDNMIIDYLGFSSSSYGYFRYLLHMRNASLKLKEVYAEQSKGDLEEHLLVEGRQWLDGKSPPPMAVYLDEWCWMRITKGYE